MRLSALFLLLATLPLLGCAPSKTAFDAGVYERNVERTANESFNQRLTNP